MTKYKLLTSHQKAVIIALKQENLSMRVISRRIKCNPSTVSRFIKKYVETGTMENKKRGRPKKKSTAREDRVLQRLCLANRASTSTELRSEWNEATGVSVSTKTVRRRIKSMGLKAQRPARKPLLTQKMKKKRLTWALQHKNWTNKDWEKVIFSDESKFNVHGSDGINYVFRRKGERLKDECLKKTTKFPTSVMVWGCFSSKGVGYLRFIDGTVKAQNYIQILNECLLPTIKKQFKSVKQCIFQDDSAPCHRAKIVKDFIQNKRITTLPWPGNSPDLNPIENCWFEISKMVAHKKPKNKKDLIAAIEKVWKEDLEVDYLKTLVKSMPSRIQAVINAKGGSTKY